MRKEAPTAKWAMGRFQARFGITGALPLPLLYHYRGFSFNIKKHDWSKMIYNVSLASAVQ